MSNNAPTGSPAVNGEQKTWHKISGDLASPEAFTKTKLTFRDSRLDVTFPDPATGDVITVPGLLAADGDAANTNVTAGNVWRVNFHPPSAGEWIYEAALRTGTGIAASTNPHTGQAVDFIDGERRAIAIAPIDKTGNGCIRSGPSVPKNFLTNQDIDNTANGRPNYTPYADDNNAMKQRRALWGSLTGGSSGVTFDGGDYGWPRQGNMTSPIGPLARPPMSKLTYAVGRQSL